MNDTYHLRFDCISTLDNFKRYYIIFTGTDLETNMPLVKSDQDLLKQMLKDDYGFVPFDIVKVKHTLQLKNIYHIES